MPRLRRAPRTTPDPQPDPVDDQPIKPGEGELDVPPQMAFFSRLKKISSGDWSHHAVYVYRLEPRVRNAGPFKYLEIFYGPFDEADLRERHGGGKYQAILKDVSRDEALQKVTIEVDGPPKLQKGQILVDEHGNETQLSSQPPATAPAQPANDNSMGEALNKLISVLQNQKNPADDAMTRAMETLDRAQKGAIELIINSVKKQSESVTGNPITDQLLQASIAKMVKGDDEHRRNPMDEFKTMLQTMREMQGLTGELNPRPRGGGLIEEAKAIAELLKGDSDGTIKTLLLGNRDEEGSGSGWGNIAMKFLERRPDIINSVGDILVKLAGSFTAPRAFPSPPTVLAGAAAPLPHVVQTQTAAVLDQPPSQPAPVEAQPAQISEQAVLEGILMAVVNGYRSNYSGDAVAESVKTLYPQVVPMMRQYMGYPESMLIGFLRSQPVMAPIANNPDFPEFVHDFKKEIMRDDNEPGSDEQPDGEQGSGPPAEAE
jgi:hypothetical protein